jgi:hypothetical protein
MKVNHTGKYLVYKYNKIRTFDVPRMAHCSILAVRAIKVRLFRSCKTGLLISILLRELPIVLKIYSVTAVKVIDCGGG